MNEVLTIAKESQSTVPAKPLDNPVSHLHLARLTGFPVSKRKPDKHVQSISSTILSRMAIRHNIILRLGIEIMPLQDMKTNGQGNISRETR